MALSRRMLIVLMIVASLMAIFPPWVVRDAHFGSYGPPRAGGYSIIFVPPRGGVLDLGRLAVQYIALAAAATVIALKRKKPKNTAVEAYGFEDNEPPSWMRRYLPTVSRIIPMRGGSDHAPAAHSNPSTEALTSRAGDKLPRTKVRWWQYQSLKDSGSHLSVVAVLVSLIFAAAEVFIPYVGVRDAALSGGAFLGMFSIYLVSAVAASRIVWRISGRTRWATVLASCVAPLILASMIQFGEQRIHEVAMGGISTSPPSAIAASILIPTPQQRADEARAILMRELTESNHSTSFVANILTSCYANDTPWSRMDRVIEGLSANVIIAYQEWQEAEIELGHDPQLTEAELAALDRLHEVIMQAELYQLKHNGRYPDFKQWPNFPVNPFTKSNRIASAGTATRADGWSYDELWGQFRLVLPTGVTCRGLDPESVEVCP